MPGSFTRLLDSMDSSLSRQRAKASLTTKRSGSTPATKAGQDIGKRKDNDQGEEKPKGGGMQSSPPGVDGVKRVHAVSAHTDDGGYESRIGVQHDGPHHDGGVPHDLRGDPRGATNNKRSDVDEQYSGATKSDRGSMHDGSGHPESALKGQACEYCDGTGKRGGGRR